jgi:1-acyl-sn-glycerol-3-phosphate acyltransferase
MIRTAWVVLNIIVVTIPLALAIIVASFLPGSWDRLFDRIPRIWAAWILRSAGVRMHAIGLDNINTGRPQVFLANHVSFYDVLALALLIPKRYRFVGKQELTRVPLWGRAWQAAGHIAIDRANTHRAVESLDRAGRIIREDRSSVIIFPEGTRSDGGEMLPFKKGGFMLALHGGIDIIPVAIQGTRGIMPRGRWRMRAGRIIVRFGRPITTTDYTVDMRDELMARVRSEIEAMLALPAPGTSEPDVGHHQHTRS